MVRSIHPVQFVINFFRQQLCRGYFIYLCLCVCFMIPIHILAMIHGHIPNSDCDYFYTNFPVSGQIFWFHGIHVLAKPINGSRESVVGMVARLRAAKPKNLSIPGSGNISLSSPTRPDRLCRSSSLPFDVYRGLFSRSKGAAAWSWPVTTTSTHIRMTEALPPPSHNCVVYGNNMMKLNYLN